MCSLYRRPTEFTRNIGWHCLCSRATFVLVCALNTFTTCTVCRQLCRVVFCAACAAPNVDINVIKKKFDVIDRLLFFDSYLLLALRTWVLGEKKKETTLARFSHWLGSWGVQFPWFATCLRVLHHILYHPGSLSSVFCEVDAACFYSL